MSELVGELLALASSRTDRSLKTALINAVTGMARPDRVELAVRSDEGTTRRAVVENADTDSPVISESIGSESNQQPGEWPDDDRIIQAQTEDGPVCTVPMERDNDARYYLLLHWERPGRPPIESLEPLQIMYLEQSALLDQARRDPLTGLLNRRSFDETITAIVEGRTNPFHLDPFERTRRRATDGRPGSYWVGTMDIDRFKSINDRFGHLYGDEILLLVARIMRETFRRSDFLFRFGGEEFVAVVEAADAERARVAFERLRRRIDGHDFSRAGHVTISCGATRLEPAAQPLEMLGRADRALYHAKHNGRNQTHFYETLRSGNLIPPAESAQARLELF